MDSQKNIQKNSVSSLIVSVGKFLYKYWMKFAKLLATVNSFIILFVFYFIIIGIYAVITKILVIFRSKKYPESFWRQKDVIVAEGVEDLKYQF